MKTLWTLMRREMWESPGTFKWLPGLLSLLFLLLLVMSLGFVSQIDAGFASTMDSLRAFADQDAASKRELVTTVMFGVAAFFNVALLFVVFFYLAGSLYDDRKDRSILFWKSLPVSDSSTVISKLLTACLVLPACFFAGVAITQVLLLVITSFYALAAGVGPWSTLWAPAGLPGMWVKLIIGYLIHAIWMFPIYGWLMLCSAWAPRFPVLIAIGVPVVAGLLQNYHSFLTSFRWADYNLLSIIGTRFTEATIPLRATLETDQATLSLVGMGRNEGEQVANFTYMFERMTSASMWIGVIIGAIFLAGAIWGRRRATDS